MSELHKRNYVKGQRTTVEVTLIVENNEYEHSRQYENNVPVSI